jgi:hypothetical protein
VKGLLGLLSFRNRRTGQCNPSLGTAAKRLGVPGETLRRWVRELRRAGIVVSTPNLGSSNSYRFSFAAPDGEVGERPPRSTTTPEGVQIHPTEPEVFEPEEGNHTAADADNKLRTVVAPEKPRPPAAAAAGDAGASTPVENNATTVEAETLVAELIPNHPEPGNPGRAVAEARTVLAASPDPEATAKTIRANHGSWREHWATLPRDRFIPQLWRWLNSGEWKYAPVERKGIARETWQERRRREGADDQDRYYRMLAEHGMWDALREYGQDPEVWRAKTA